MNGLHDVGWAVRQMQDGHRVRRREWKWGTFIVLMPELQLLPYSTPSNTPDVEQKVNYPIAKLIGEDKPLNCGPHIARHNLRKQWQPGWVCTLEDLLGTDWEIVGE